MNQRLPAAAPPHSLWSLVGEDYKIALRDLTFNSKPIINNLTFFAQEHASSASELSQILGDHLVNCHPDIKLPALYLIDSICKNIGEPFVGFFINILPSIFPAAYRQLRDEKVKRDFGRTLDTWWGFFPDPMCVEVQRKTFGTAVTESGRRRPLEEDPYHQDDGRRVNRGMAHQIPSAAGYPGHSGNSGHPGYSTHGAPLTPAGFTKFPPQPPPVLQLLHDLRAAVTVPPEVYNEKLVAEIMYRLEYASAHDPRLFAEADRRARLVDKRPLVELVDSILYVSQATSSYLTPAPLPTNNSNGSARSPVLSNSGSAPISPDVTPLLQSLSSFLGPAAGKFPTASPSVLPVYEEIIKNRPMAYKALYNELPRQCTNCGLRFPDTPEGGVKLEAHLDAHFRRNIRLKDKSKKVFARIWLQKENDWINNVEAQTSEQPAALFSSSNASNADAATGKNRFEDPAGEFHKVSAGADHAERHCPICQEKIEIAWDDDADEWVYKNAIKQDDSDEVGVGAYYRRRYSFDEAVGPMLNGHAHSMMIADCHVNQISFSVYGMSNDSADEGSWSIILRSGDEQQVVLYNEDQKRVILKNIPPPPAALTINPKEVTAQFTTAPSLVCALCKRPFENGSSPFMDQNYFRLLQETYQEYAASEQKSKIFEEIRNIPLGAFNQGYYKKFFREGRKLGRGARGSVFLAQHILEDEFLGEYAIKKVPVGDNAQWLQNMLKEVHIMESLRHPNIISYKHTWLEVQRLSPFAPSVPCLFILMEYANGGNLEDYVMTEAEAISSIPSNRRGSREIPLLSLDEVLEIFLGICRGLQHLHEHGIIHRDLKPSNILLHYPSERTTHPDILLSDFGECNRADEDSCRGTERTGATGTIEFCAPELFRQDKRGHYVTHHSKATDVWSLGMILYYLLYDGRLPYLDIENVEVLRRDILKLRKIVLPHNRDDTLSTSVRQLLLSLLSLRSEMRPTAAVASQTIEAALASIAYQRDARRSSSKGSPQLLPGRVADLSQSCPLFERIPVWLVSASLGLGLFGFCYPHAFSMTSLFILSLPVIAERLGARRTAIFPLYLLCLAVYLLIFKAPCTCANQVNA